MIRPTLRILVFAATIAASLSLSQDAQAEERKSFFSRLNPKTWFQKKDNKGSTPVEQNSVNERSGTELSSSRAYLKDDPFGAAPGETGTTLPAVSPKVAATPPVNRDPVPVPRPSANRPVARTPLAPENRSGSVRVSDSEARPELNSVPVAAKAPRTSKVRPGGNDFVDDFDKDYAKIMVTTRRDSLPDTDEEPQPQAKPSSVAKTAASRPETKTVARTAAPTRNSDLPSLPDLPDESVPETPNREVARTSSNARRQAALDELARVAREDANLSKDAEDGVATTRPKAELERSVASRQRAQKPVIRQSEPDVEEVETRPVSTSYTDRMPMVRSEQRPLPRTETFSPQREKPSGLKLVAPDTLNSLIVSNELVPERRHYTGSQSYRTGNVMSPESADELPVVTSGAPGSRSFPGQSSFAASNEPVATVSSNRASSRSVSDHSKFQQMSFDETEGESRLPLLSIGAGSKPAGADHGPMILLPSSSKSGNEAVIGRENGVSKESAPAFDFPEKAASTGSKKAPYGTLFTILGLMAVGCGVGLRLRRKGQLATAGQSPSRASHENVG